MTTAQATIPVSRADVLRLQHEAGIEYVNGQYLEKPVSRDSSWIEGKIARLLANAIGDSGYARVFPSSLGYQCFADDPAKFRKPDVSVIRSERLSEEDEGLMHVPPDLAVEVVSPGDTASELDDKVLEYLANGFRLVWVVFPSSRSVVVHRPAASPVRLSASQEITGESAVPTFRCKVAEFFEG